MRQPRRRGKAVQVKPIKLSLKPPRTNRLKLKYDEPLSSFAFKINVRHYSVACYCSRATAGRGLSSSTFQLNLSRQAEPKYTLHTPKYP